ncbi:putative splicing factor, arginine/serine-rich 6 [Diplogelasinospora grovesii]|uniref:Splicing factor, arginine/serine-rich 6 n=1 Tax=Diplogelasinospora grovesii TaxID=303347 RepID=A0AAN6N8Y6_9PEZI|nr:putative splicing factor, arginine/serine-rich 6 [Diplogelasinospora grovesii]
MSEQSPEVVATADLSPLSPAPISAQASSPALVPKLQDHADTLDVASLDHPPVPALPSWTSFTMPPEMETTDISDTIVVGGDDSDDSQGESDNSFDAYGEDEDEEVEEHQEVEPKADNDSNEVDDYARTFDSPAAQDEIEVDGAQPDVSRASESMISSDAPDLLKPQSLAAPISVPSSSSPDTSRANGGPLQGLSTSQSEPAAAVHAPTSESPSNAPVVSAPEPVTEASAEAAAPLVSPSSAHVPVPHPTSAAAEDDATIDIQKLVDEITARAAAAASASSTSTSALTAETTQTPSQTVPGALNVTNSASSTLPPKPTAVPQIPPYQPSAANANAHAPPTAPNPSASPTTPRGTYTAGGAPGTASNAVSSMSPPPSAFLNGGQAQSPSSLTNAHHMPTAGGAPGDNIYAPASNQTWEAFLAEEKRYTTEARWERFPEGSRIFVGNLSIERVPKRAVFDVFSKFGHLAQISLKSAYGFVQYHTAAEGQAAMQNAQGIQLGGRTIHLEVSRVQKKFEKKEHRERSPERRNQRGTNTSGGWGETRNDRRGDQGWRRDDYRPGRSPSPRRNDGRDAFHHRDHRSQSPPRYGRSGANSYRRRSPSPRGRPSSDDDRLDMPRRYGNDVPDVQLLLLQEVQRDFVGWIQGIFRAKGLRTDVMYLNPRFPREAMIGRQVLEGVHGIIELDYAAQAQGKVSIQVFNRSGAGGASVRFDMYKDIDPAIAAELVLREKSQSSASQRMYAQPPPYAPRNNYGNPYPAGSPPPPAGYPAYQQPPQLPSHQYPTGAYGQAAAAAPAPAAAAANLANMVGQLDNASLQALLASLQTGQGAASQAAAAPMMPGMPHGSDPHAQQIDINALLGNLRNAANGGGGAAAPMTTPSYQAAPPTYAPAAGSYGLETAQQVQTIIDQLKRAAQ